MHACFARNYPEALTHHGHGHALTSVAQLSVINVAEIKSTFYKALASECFQLSVINVAEIKSTFYKALASECFHRNAVDGAP